MLLLCLHISCNKNNSYKDENSSVKKDSAAFYLKKGKDRTISKAERKKALTKSYQISLLKENDSLKNRAILRIAYQAYTLKDSVFFKQTNNDSHNLSLQLKDTFSLAQVYWNKGLFSARKEKLDSSYYHYSKAYKYYKALNRKILEGKMLYKMAVAQKDSRDYTGSEISVIQAIKRFNKKEHALQLYNCYNLLGIIYTDLSEFDKGIKYYKTALEHLENIKSKKSRKEGNLNNLGLLYTKQGKYSLANTNFKEALKNKNLKSSNISLYAKLIDNFAYSKLLNGDTLNLKQEFHQALKIRDSIKFISGILLSDLHISEYHIYKKDTVQAIKYAKEALLLAKSVDNNRDYLVALKLLSKIDTKNAITHLENHLKLTDSFNDNDRKLRNKFERIRFETDEHIEEADKQAKEKLFITGVSALLIIILSLLYFIRHQRAKNKELKLETEQQRANENIYGLLLKQQTKLEEGRLNERHRISQELHDGVLGKIFATRMRLDFLDIDGEEDMQQKYQTYLGELQDVEKEIRVISHELKNELLSDKSNFTQIIEHLITEQSAIFNYDYHLEEDHTVDWNMTTDFVKINCYRIIQETLQNINKHAKANKVSIKLSQQNNILSLVIKDDGVGFDTKKHKVGIGIQNITDRVKKLNGTFALTSSIGQGSTLSINLPVTM